MAALCITAGRSGALVTGFILLNYGRRTPLATIIAHVAYGTIVGGFTALAA